MLIWKDKYQFLSLLKNFIQFAVHYLVHSSKPRSRFFMKVAEMGLNEASQMEGATNIHSECQKGTAFVSILQNFSPKLMNFDMNNNNNKMMLRELHTSLTLTTEKCMRFLHSFASQNPIIQKLLSFSSHLHSIQVNCRNHENTSTLSNHNFAAVLPGDSVTGIVVANGIINLLNIYNTLLIVRLVLTWFPNAPPAIVSPLSTLCDPYLNIFRGLIPPLGGTLDFSPILAFLVLNAFTSTAAALPAELPVNGTYPRSPSSHTSLTNLTSSQQKWMKRLIGNQSQSPGDDKPNSE